MSVLRLIVALLALVVSTPAAAHQLWPSYLQLTQTDSHRVQVFWKVPVRAGEPLPIVPILPEHCATLTAPAPDIDDRSARSNWIVDCGSAGLVGQDIRIEGLASVGSDVVVRVELADGTVSQGIVPPDTGTLRIEPAAAAPTLWRYLPVGIEHILLGPDHLMFVFGLLLVIGTDRRRLLGTLTAFTVAHSATLALAVFNLVHLPQRAVEAIIALSILALAAEIARGTDSMTARHPHLVAAACGLIHGLGFAGALSDIGLPPDAIPGALLLFNLGVEAGQLLFVAAALAALPLLRLVPLRPKLLLTAAAYVLGITSATWFLQRTILIFT
ncbi:MAG: hypothetical protein ACI8S6_000053 [Myxococcota bacterium]|jgi:hypothetical protein